MANRTVSRAALLELRNERRVVEDGYRFLDEKRALLAHAVLERLPAFAAELDALRAAQVTARTALGDAVGAEGLETLQLRRVPVSPARRLVQRIRSFLGIRVAEDPRIETASEAVDTTGPGVDLLMSPATERCRAAYGHVVESALPVAVELGNLVRLMHEFQRTQRRVRALEKVVLPELRSEERRMEDVLEEVDQEDAVRVRLAGRHRGG